MKFGKTISYLFKIIFISILSVGLAFAFNMVRPNSYSLDDVLSPQSKEIVEISTSAVTAAYDAGNVQMVDARSEMDFAMGHIPGAINVPSSTAEGGAVGFSDILDKSLPVIVYCDGLTCGKSLIVAKRLIELGFRDVSVYTDGIDGWLSAGRDLEAN